MDVKSSVPQSESSCAQRYMYIVRANRVACLFLAYSYLFSLIACVGYAFPWHSNYQRYVHVWAYLLVCTCRWQFRMLCICSVCVGGHDHRPVYTCSISVCNTHVTRYMHVWRRLHILASICTIYALWHLLTCTAGTCITSDDTVTRDIRYNGNPIQERCTVISRIAPTFIRSATYVCVCTHIYAYR